MKRCLYIFKNIKLNQLISRLTIDEARKKVAINATKNQITNYKHKNK